MCVRKISNPNVTILPDSDTLFWSQAQKAAIFVRLPLICRPNVFPKRIFTFLIGPIIVYESIKTVRGNFLSMCVVAKFCKFAFYLLSIETRRKFMRHIFENLVVSNFINEK
jgi:hypothetical protein